MLVFELVIPGDVSKLPTLQQGLSEGNGIFASSGVSIIHHIRNTFGTLTSLHQERPVTCAQEEGQTNETTGKRFQHPLSVLDDEPFSQLFC